MKYAFIALAFILLFGSMAFATITIAKPVQQTIPEDQVFELGEIEAGQSFDLIVSKYSVGTEGKAWESFIITLPTDWKMQITPQPNNPNTIVYVVTVPARAASQSYSIQVKSVPGASGLQSQVVSLLVKVSDNLIRADVDNLSQTTTVGVPVSYRGRLQNNSIATARVRIDSDSGSLWFKPIELSIPPKQSEELNLVLNPGHYGKKPFQFFVYQLDGLNRDPVATFDAELIVNPTLKSKFSSSLNGFPFFTPSLLPYYLLNGFLSILS